MFVDFIALAVSFLLSFMFSRSSISLVLYFVIYSLFMVIIASIVQGQLMQMTCEDMQCDLQCVQQFKCREARCEWMNNQYGRGKSPPHVYFTVFLSLIRSTIQGELFISLVDDKLPKNSSAKDVNFTFEFVVHTI